MTASFASIAGRRVAALVTALAFAIGACSDDGGTGPDDAPESPINVQAAAASASSVSVTWTAVTGASSYIVERAPGSGGTFAQVGTATQTTFTDTGLQGGTSYRYRVYAVNDAGTSGASSEIAVTTPAGGPKVATINTDITASRTLFADTVYTISGFVHVASGATLTIQPGTIIQGDFNTLGSSLFILRGARILAVGTEASPIVFTSSRPVGQRQPGDWGGLVLVGNAPINRSAPVLLEGTNTGPTNPAVDYSGGANNADDSGELKYVRVEFAGYGPAQDAELNSFTFAAVGSATRLSFLQSMSGLDDSFEFFGGQADARNLVSYESGDDHFDMAEGYQGRMQYLIAYQTRVLIPRAGAGNVSNDPQGIENDGCSGANCTNGQNSTPLTIPLVANFTLVGTGAGVVDATSGGIGMMVRRGSGGYYVNGVVARWPRAAISLRDNATNDRITAGELLLKNLLLSDVTTVFQPTAGSNVQFTVDQAANNIEQTATTTANLFVAFAPQPTSATQLDWTPKAGSPSATGGLNAFTGAIATKAGAAVSATAYRGAADPAGPKWWQNWTIYADN